jgi:hypothetical protein
MAVATRRRHAMTRTKTIRLETATTMAGLAAARVGGDGGDVFDAADLHASAGEGTKRGHAARTRGLGSATTCQPCGDTKAKRERARF